MAETSYKEKIRETLRQNLMAEEKEISKIDREIAQLKKERKRRRKDVTRGEKIIKELNIPIKKQNRRKIK